MRGRRIAGSLTLAALLAVAVRSLSLGQGDPCVQPSSEPCPLAIGIPVAAVLDDPSSAHAWQLSTEEGRSVRVTLTALAADLDLQVVGSNGEVVAESANEGTLDEVVDLPGNPEGYVVWVWSSRGEATAEPYGLIAGEPTTAEATPTPQAISPYQRNGPAVTPVVVIPYRTR